MCSGYSSLKIVHGCGTALLVVLVNTLPASADQYDTLNYTAAAGVNYDDNIYRLPSSVDPLPVIGNSSKSDHIRFVSLGVNVDKKYSNQDLVFSANASENKYATFSSLDYNGTAYSAAWNWTMSSRFSGTLSTRRTQTLNSFADIHTYTRNLQTYNERHLNADWWVESGWHLLAGATNGEWSNSYTTVNNSNYYSNTDEWGVKYVLADGNSLALISRNVHAYNSNTSPNYVTEIDTGYTERQEEFQFSWMLSGASALNGSMMNIRHSFPLFSQRDYGGNQDSLAYTWSITDKLRLNMSLKRSINTWLDLASSYYVSDTVSMSPSWQISSKVDMHMDLSHGNSDYRGEIVPGVATRHDGIESYLVGFGWYPQRSVRFDASLQHSRRTSNYSAYEFSDTTASLSASTTF